MIPRIKSISALDNFILHVLFDDGKVVDYDVKEDIDAIPSFAPLRTEHNLFRQFELDPSRTCVTWNEEIDIPSDSIYEFGVTV